MIDKDGSGAVIALNKWDLMLEKLSSGEEGDRVIREVRKDIKSLPYAPIVSTCALSGQRVPKLVEQLVRIAALQQRTIPAGQLTNFIEDLQRFKPIPMYRGKPVEIHRMTQTTAAPARFRLFVRGYIPDNYLKFIENRLRGAFDLEGIPARFMIVRV
jgi:GTP-binding protein